MPLLPKTKDIWSRDQPMIQDSPHYMVKISFKLSTFHWNFTRLQQPILCCFVMLAKADKDKYEPCKFMENVSKI